MKAFDNNLQESFFKHITIVGLGLIGGSWALALRSGGFGGVIEGCDRPSVLEAALAAGAIDRGFEDLSQAIAAADLIILAAPVGAIVKMLPRLTAAPRTALVTDTGSTKALVCRQAAAMFGDGPLFLGGHPLAGKEFSGLAHASATLFQGARYVITPLSSEHLADPRVMAFEHLVALVGGRVLRSTPPEHDHAVAYLSHLPQLVSTALASSLFESVENHELEFGASGFRDMTRLAESSYELWRDICASNAENIGAALERMIEKLKGIRASLAEPALEREFRQASALRHKRPPDEP